MTNPIKIERKPDLNDRQQNVYETLARTCKRTKKGGLSDATVWGCFDGRTLKALIKRGYLTWTDEIGYRIVK